MLGSTRAVAKDQERAPQEWRGKDQRLGQLTGCLLLRSASSDFGVMLAICCRIHPWKHAHLAKNQCSRLLRTYIEHALLLVTAQCPLFSLHASLHCTPEQCLHVQTMRNSHRNFIVPITQCGASTVRSQSAGIRQGVPFVTVFCRPGYDVHRSRCEANLQSGTESVNPKSRFRHSLPHRRRHSFFDKYEGSQ